MLASTLWRAMDNMFGGQPLGGIRVPGGDGFQDAPVLRHRQRRPPAVLKDCSRAFWI
jgi:hypothetical protein